MSANFIVKLFLSTYFKVSANKGVKRVFSEYRSKNPDAWDWKKCRVPEPTVVNEEKLQRDAEKRKQQKERRKEREKARKEEERVEKEKQVGGEKVADVVSFHVFFLISSGGSLRC